MKVSEKDVAYVAELANLDLTAQERDGMVRDLNSILGYMDVLNELDTSAVPPMTQISGHEHTSTGIPIETGREDLLEGLRPSLSHEAALANAPDSDGMFFRVPRVIEK